MERKQIEPDEFDAETDIKEIEKEEGERQEIGTILRSWIKMGKVRKVIKDYSTNVPKGKQKRRREEKRGQKARIVLQQWIKINTVRETIMRYKGASIADHRKKRKMKETQRKKRQHPEKKRREVWNWKRRKKGKTTWEDPQQKIRD